MTENEIHFRNTDDCIKKIKSIRTMYRDTTPSYVALSDAIQAIEEIRQIKEIISNFPLDCGSPVEDVKEIYRQLRGFLQIGTIEDFKALKEKSVAKKQVSDVGGCIYNNVERDWDFCK